ncbi:hypothetical protein ACFQ3B_20100 [Stackebrandtia endophytica]|nr:hypothetical protein [Stackebrandtia endophytica]
MKRPILPIMTAAAGAVAYSVSKVDLAFRGELGMPGFPAPRAAYDSYEPFSGQLSNAAMGVLLVLLILALARLPTNRWARRALLIGNGVAVTVIGLGVAGFAVRATGAVPWLGAPADGAAAWIALAVGALWTVAWSVAIRRAARSRSASAVEAG